MAVQPDVCGDVDHCIVALLSKITLASHAFCMQQRMYQVYSLISLLTSVPGMAFRNCIVILLVSLLCSSQGNANVITIYDSGDDYTPGATNCYVFQDCVKDSTLCGDADDECGDIEDWDVSRVTNMDQAFGEKPYACNFCAYRASVKSTLRSHIRRRHDGGDM